MPAKITLLLFFLFLTGLSPKLVAQSPWTYVGDVDADLTHVGYGRCGELLGESPSAIYTSVDGGLTWTLLTARPHGKSAVRLLQLPTQSIVLLKSSTDLTTEVPACGSVAKRVTSLPTYQVLQNSVTASIDAVVTLGRRIVAVQQIPVQGRSASYVLFAAIDSGETIPESATLNRYARLEQGRDPRADSLFLQQPRLLSRDRNYALQVRRGLEFRKPAGADTLFYSNLVSLDAADTLVTVWTRAGQPEGFLVARRGLPDGSWTTQEIDRGQLREVRADGSTAMAILATDGVYFAPDARVSAFVKTLPARPGIATGQLNADATEAIRVLADGRLERQRLAGVDTIGRPRIGNGAGVLQTTAAGTLLVGGDGRWYEFDPRQPSAVPNVVDLAVGVSTRVDTIGGRAYRQVWTEDNTLLIVGDGADADTIYRSSLLETLEFVGGGAGSRILLRADGNLLVRDGRTESLPDLLRGPLQVIGADTVVVDGGEIKFLSAAGRRTVPFEARPPGLTLVPRVYREDASFLVAYTKRISGPTAQQLYSFTIDPREADVVTYAHSELEPVLFQAGERLYIGRGAPRPLFGVQPTAAAGIALTVPTAAFVAEAGICYYSGGGRGHAPFSKTCPAYAPGVRGIVRLGDRVYISGDGGIYSQFVVCSPLDTVRLDTAIVIGEVLAGVRVDRVGQTVTAELPIAGSACTQPVVYRVTQVVSVGIPASLQTARIFPNPVSSTLRVDGLPADGVATTITIRDLLGRTIAPPQTTLGMDATTVDVATLPSGVYLVQVTRPEGSRVWKVQRY